MHQRNNRVFQMADKPDDSLWVDSLLNDVFKLMLK